MTDGGEEIQVVIFTVADQAFGFEISQVERILRHATPTPLPQAAAFLEGMIRYGDGMVPVVDLRKRLGTEAAVGEESRIVVLAMEDQLVGILVDRVDEVYRLNATAVSAAPKLVRGLAAKYITGLVQRDDQTVILLNAVRLFSSNERVQLAAAADGVAAGRR